MTILGDWGTQHLRLYRVEGHVIVDRLVGPGVNRLDVAPSAALMTVLAPWIDHARSGGVRLCGMAGGRNGIVELDYLTCPVDRDFAAKAAVSLVIDDIRVIIAPGLCGSDFTGRADVMRGEETRIFGALRLDTALAAGRSLLVLPGTHSKWVELRHGAITHFHTFPTGEMFALLGNQSAMGPMGDDASGGSEGFALGLKRARVGLRSGMFEARAAALGKGRNHPWALGVLWGLLIGSEIMEAFRWRKGIHRIVLLGRPELCALYRTAFAMLGLADIRFLDSEACTVAGLEISDRAPAW